MNNPDKENFTITMTCGPRLTAEMKNVSLTPGEALELLSLIKEVTTIRNQKPTGFTDMMLKKGLFAFKVGTISQKILSFIKK